MKLKPLLRNSIFILSLSLLSTTLSAYTSNTSLIAREERNEGGGRGGGERSRSQTPEQEERNAASPWGGSGGYGSGAAHGYQRGYQQGENNESNNNQGSNPVYVVPQQYPPPQYPYVPGQYQSDPIQPY